jgi:hypothetical protein
MHRVALALLLVLAAAPSRVEVMTGWVGKGYMTFPKAAEPG